MKLIAKLYLAISLVTIANTFHAQGIAVSSNAAQPDPSAMLDVSSNSKGVLISRMTTAQRDQISNPAVGLQIFNTDSNCFNVYDGVTWRKSCYECDFNTSVVGNNGPLCEGSTLNLTATTVPGATYSWTGPNGFSSSSQNPVIPSITASGNGVYYLSVTLNNCTANAVSTSVTVSPTPQTPTASNNGPACQGGTIDLTASNIFGAAYNWTGPNGFSSTNQNPQLTNATPSMSGNYTVSVVVNGCVSNSQSTSVTVNATPQSPVAGSNSPICEEVTLNLTASNVANATYSWTGPNGFSSNDQNPFIVNTTQNSSGLYSVVATVNNCPSLAGTTTVVINSAGVGGSQTFNYSGNIQDFVVPNCVFTIHADVRGAQGGGVNGGYGARMQGDISVTPGEILKVLVGEKGKNSIQDATHGGGGGGSFLVRGSNTLLIAAGGGGGGPRSVNTTLVDASIGQNGNNDAGNNAQNSGGTGGSGGTAGGAWGGSGGAGFLGNGTNGQGNSSTQPNGGGKSWANGMAAGQHTDQWNYAADGGYGGGGASSWAGGGGGGYSGGAGKYSVGSGSERESGGGGGSYNIGTNQDNSAGVQTGNGSIVLTW